MRQSISLIFDFHCAACRCDGLATSRLPLLLVGGGLVANALKIVQKASRGERVTLEKGPCCDGLSAIAYRMEASP